MSSNQSQHSQSSNPQGGGSIGSGGGRFSRRPRHHRSRRRPGPAQLHNRYSIDIHSADAASSSVSSVSSGAGVNANPRRNRNWQRRDECEEEEEEDDAVKIKGMEVMDHATRATEATRRTSETSSSDFVGSNSADIGIVDGESAAGLFRVAGIGIDGGDENIEGVNTDNNAAAAAADDGDPDSLRGDNMPKHWHWRADHPPHLHHQRGGILGSIHEARRGLRAPGTRTTPGTVLPALRGGSDDDLFSSSGGSSSIGIDVELDDDELGADVGSVGTSGSGKLWDRIESDRHITESKASERARTMLAVEKSAERRATRRRTIARRVVGAVALGVALTTLSASAAYFVGDEDFDEVIPSAVGFLAGLFDGGGGDALREEVGKGALDHLAYRKLPIEGDVLRDGTATASPLREDHGNRQFDGGISRQERNRMAREERIETNRRAREGRILAREERLARNAAQQENVLI